MFSTHLPESVCGTDTNTTPLAAFLGSMGSTGTLAPEGLSSHHVSRIADQSFDRADHLYTLEPDTTVRRPVYPSPSLLVSSLNS